MPNRPPRTTARFDNINDLDDFADEIPFVTDKRDMDDVLDTPLVLLAVQEATGNLGQFIVITCKIPESDTMFVVTTGAAQVMDKLLRYKALDRLPVKAQFVQQGRAYFVVSAKAKTTTE